ncbi:hypothetical protein ASF22_22435 [Methylobacterium sp. Leaf87]|uniref:hypothetical protein n=1 Tax=Methylobacterium sp. Leaf87 TaxID=1736243 RepID=UPI0006F5DFF9|nr:hypothetical protein [Methylobacterium sp. Leaf87]KQO60173.1 hypothetical protein ASF22_22435 [Methylobacterium sp. Leaf87]
MPRSARFAPFSLNATRPHATPPEIVGRRRMDPLDRCKACRHHTVVKGPTPGGEIVGIDLCWYYRTELLIPLASTRPCPLFQVP